ncbi:MAG: DUF5597 domain-containing protein [Armatimonadota bacterium]|nr:MAG: DUF5597 domain-containing protein [Armatimonadota bacterium]
MLAIVALCVCAACAAPASAGETSGAALPIPRLEHSDAAYHLMVDGNPFLILGGQALNKSAVKDEDLEGVWKALTAIHANTAIVPLHWRVIEPEPGQFDFRVLDSIVNGARRNGLRLVLLWFGTYKNGEMDYTPDWMKNDRATYARAIGFRGEQLNTMSPLCEAALDADIRAFTAVMRHLLETDRNHRTVIMVQVENEPGLIGTDRDHSEQATRLFESDVPSELMAYLGQHRDDLTASLRSAWSESEFRSSGTWTEVFGDFAAEAFSAWHIARYTDRVAAAGREVYALPMYANAWVIEPHGERAGRWPSGGPTEHVLDIWKAAAPHLDLIAPDIYYPKFYDDAVPYARPDNPLFVPEVNFMPFFGAHAFMTFATFDGLGIAPYGIDAGVDNQGWEIIAAEFEDTYRVLRPLLPVIARHRYMGKMHAIIQGISPGEDWAHDVHLADETVAALVEFTVQLDVERGRGRGLIIELAPDDYVIAGAGFNVTFRELQGPLRDTQLLSLEEGTFEDGQWVRHRRLNGDELHVRLPAKAKILRVRLARP